MLSRRVLWLAWIIIAQSVLVRGSDEGHALPVTWEGRRVIGVGVAFAEETSDAPVSAFGHVFAYLRTVDAQCKPWPLDLETGINVAVDSHGSLREARYHTELMHRMLHEMMVKEGRSVVLIEIAMSDKSLGEMVSFLTSNVDVKVPYDFFRKNCGYYILQWIGIGHPEIIENTKDRLYLTPRATIDSIESFCRIEKRTRLTSSEKWNSNLNRDAHKVTRELMLDRSWIKNGEGVLIGVGTLNARGATSVGGRIEYGLRDSWTQPTFNNICSQLHVVEITYFESIPRGNIDAKLLEYETIREWKGADARLSQRLEVGRYLLPRIDGLSGWVGQYETGVGTHLEHNIWVGGMMGLSSSSVGGLRPLVSFRIFAHIQDIYADLTLRSTGGDKSGARVCLGWILTPASTVEIVWNGSMAKEGYSLNLSLAWRM